MNAIDQFRDAIAASGLTPPEVIETDGKLHRFPSNGKARDLAGWYILHADGIPAGAFGCWRADIRENWRADIGRTLTPVEEAEHRTRFEAIQKERDAERARRHAEARKKAATIWQAANPALDNHPYLARKGVKAHGLRVDKWALVVPMHDGDDLRSLQFIGPDGDKRFLTGGQVQGCYFIIGKPEGAAALCIAEGYATAASIHEATGYPVAIAFNAGNLGLVAKAMRERFPDLSLILCADDDAATAGNPGLTKATEAALAVGGLLAVPDFGENRPEGVSDLNDLAQHRGLEAVKEAIAKSSGGGEGHTEKLDKETVEKLAKLSPFDYDRVREAEAARLGLRLPTLDAEVRKARGETAEDTAQGQAVICHDVEPWPDPVDGAELLDEVADRLASYLVLPERAADALALWAAYAHAFRAFVHSPRLNITAPQKQCGKTLVLDVLETLTPRAQRTENLTTAVLFRLVQKHAPTLLIDEYDTFLRDNEEMRGALKAGHKRGGVFLRCEGDNNEVRAFRVFCPAVLAGIRPLPGTLHDRSIVISMTRAKPGEIQRAFDMRKTEGEHVLNRKLSRWTRDNFEALEAAEPRLPAGAFNRVADNWRPLFAIASCAVGGWPARAKLAFESLDNSGDDTESYAVMLLADIGDLFEQRHQVDKLFSEDIVEYLHTLEDRPWPEWGRSQKPITKNQVARLLRTFKIKSGTKRQGDKTFKGYYRESFKDAFSRFLPPIQTVTPSQPKPGAASGDFQNVTPENNVTDENSLKPASDMDCDGVTDQKGVTGETAWTERI